MIPTLVKFPDLDLFLHVNGVQNHHPHNIIVVALNAWYMVQIMILKLMLKFRNVMFCQNNDISVCLAVCYMHGVVYGDNPVIGF